LRRKGWECLGRCETQNFTWKTSRKGLLGRPMHRWEDNIKINLRERGYELDSSGSGKGLTAGFCDIGVPQKAWNFLTS